MNNCLVEIVFLWQRMSLQSLVEFLLDKLFEQFFRQRFLFRYSFRRDFSSGILGRHVFFKNALVQVSFAICLEEISSQILFARDLPFTFCLGHAFSSNIFG